MKSLAQLINIAWKADTCGCLFCPERKGYVYYCGKCEKHFNELIKYCGAADPERRKKEWE
jgi:hypothetical protein